MRLDDYLDAVDYRDLAAAYAALGRPFGREEWLADAVGGDSAMIDGYV